MSTKSATASCYPAQRGLSADSLTTAGPTIPYLGLPQVPDITELAVLDGWTPMAMAQLGLSPEAVAITKSMPSTRWSHNPYYGTTFGVDPRGDPDLSAWSALSSGVMLVSS